MKVVKLSPTVAQVSYPSPPDLRQPFLLLSDIHWDNPHCDRVLLKVLHQREPERMVLAAELL